MKIIKILLAFAIILLPSLSTAEVLDQEALKRKMFADLDIIKNTFEVKYAPADWKFSFTRWDLEEEINIAKAKILSVDNITVNDYQHIVKDFFKSAKDYHVGVHFYSTASAFLPFRVQRAEGKYFLTWVDASARKILHVGDEITQFDDQPIHDAVTQLKMLEFGNPDSQTDQAFAEMFLTIRIGQMGHYIPQGSINVVIKSKGAAKTFTHQFTWTYTPDGVMQEAFYPLTFAVCKKSTQESSQFNISKFQEPSGCLTQHPYFHKEMSVASYNLVHAAFEQRYAKNKDEDEINEAEVLGSKKSFVPILGKKIWEAETTGQFYAYLYRNHKNKMIGYIRIPGYMGGSSAAEEFAGLIRLFEKKSDALVIDQVNNPGGIILNMYALVSMLTPYSLHVPTQRVTITQEDVFHALNVLSAFEDIGINKTTLIEGEGQGKAENIEGYPIDQKFVQSIIENYYFIIAEWNEGRCFTKASYLYGIESLTPHPLASYSKPILVLVNHLDFSCADFLPAILQDNKRATIFGTQTAGAGGVLLSHSHPNRFGIANYTLTGSIAIRHNKGLIENNGVTPDVIYELTQKDFQDNYSGYSAAVERAINKLIKKNKQPTIGPRRR